MRDLVRDEARRRFVTDDPGTPMHYEDDRRSLGLGGHVDVQALLRIVAIGQVAFEPHVCWEARSSRRLLAKV